MRIENNELRIFQAVIEANGFNKAAERLHISQSAVSQSISNLESKLDFPEPSILMVTSISVSLVFLDTFADLFIRRILA